MSQADFATEVGVSDRSVGMWERDANPPSRSNVDLIARTLDVPSDELFAFLLDDGKLRTIPLPMRPWLDTLKLSPETTIGELSERIRR